MGIKQLITGGMFPFCGAHIQLAGKVSIWFLTTYDSRNDASINKKQPSMFETPKGKDTGRNQGKPVQKMIHKLSIAHIYVSSQIYPKR